MQSSAQQSKSKPSSLIPNSKFRIPNCKEYPWQVREREKGGDSIDLLNLPTAAWNCLRRSQIDTIQELLELSPRKVGQIKNLGAVSLNAIKKALKEKGYTNHRWK